MTELDLDFRDRAVFLPASDTLVLADLHLGRSRTAPIESPLDEIMQIPERIRDLIEHFDAARVIIGGDILDAFDTIPPGVTDRFAELQTQLADLDVTLTLLRGNHDSMLGTLYDGTLQESITVGHTAILHGHTRPAVNAERYIIGHEHPAIRIEGVKQPAYLYGPGVLDGSDVLILPAFSSLVRGTVFNTRTAEDCHSPLVQSTDLGRYRPVATDDTSLVFPPLAALRPYL